ALPGAQCARREVDGGARVEAWCSCDDATMNSTMFNVKISRDEPTELHEQVAAEIRRAIADGEARPGERLPPAKDLAAVLGVNTNTVLRASSATRRRPARLPPRPGRDRRRHSRAWRSRRASKGARP